MGLRGSYATHADHHVLFTCSFVVVVFFLPFLLYCIVLYPHVLFTCCNCCYCFVLLCFLFFVFYRTPTFYLLVFCCCCCFVLLCLSLLSYCTVLYRVYCIVYWIVLYLYWSLVGKNYKKTRIWLDYNILTSGQGIWRMVYTWWNELRVGKMRCRHGVTCVSAKHFWLPYHKVAYNPTALVASSQFTPDYVVMKHAKRLPSTAHTQVLRFACGSLWCHHLLSPGI